MTGFEFVFALYSLMLGLSLAELLNGLGRALERRLAQPHGRPEFRVDWLTPMLAVFVVLDLLSFWLFAWTLREQIAVSSRLLLAVVVFASAYFMAARLVFPSEPDRFASLDQHYFRVHRIVLGILMALVFVQWAYLFTLPAMRAVIVSPLSVGLTLVLVALMGAAMVTRNVRGSAVLLALLIARYALIYLR